MLARSVSLALATLAAVAAWLTLGLQAVIDDSTRARVGVLPPWWMLGALALAFVGVTWVRRLAPARLWPLGLTALVCLPWLPGRIPPAFLIWYGPLATVVWLFAVLGLVAPAIDRLWRTPLLTDPKRAPWLVGGVALLLFVAGAWTLRGRLPGGDEPHYLIITQSLLSDHDLQIENNHARGDYFRYHVDELRPDYLQRGLNGAIYSIHAPGVSALVAPAFALAGWPGAAGFVSVVTALTAMLVWRVAWRLTGGDSVAAWVAAAAFGFTAPGYFHAFTIFPDGVGAAGVAIALWAAVRLEMGEPVSGGQLAAVGAALASLPWLHTRFAVLAGGLGAILLLRLWARPDRIRAAVALLAIPAASALAWFGFFWAIWGTPNPAAPYGQATQSAWAHLAPALPGLLFDQQFGLFANAPVYAAACLGFVALARTHRRLAIELAVVCIGYTVAVGTYRMWWGGHSAPARFLVAMLPALTLPLAEGWTRAKAPGRALTLALLVVSIVLVVPRVLVDGGELAYNERDGHDLLLEWVNRSVDLPLAWPSLHRDAVTEAWRDIAAWTVTGGLMTAAALWAAGRVGAAWTWMSAAVAVTTMVAASLVWSGAEESVTHNASALALLQEWPARPSGSGWQSSPYSLTAGDRLLAQLQIDHTRRGPRPPPGRSKPLLDVPFVPGGQYELVVTGSRPEGRLTLAVGRTTQALDVVDLAGRPPGATGVIFTLPAQVHSLTIQGDERARASLNGITLRPRAVGPAPQAPAALVRRASRYHDLRVFFFDDNVFMEPPGFWTRGSSVADVFVDVAAPGEPIPTGRPATLRLRAGPVATSVRLSTLGWSADVSLQAGEERLVPLPGGWPSGWPLRLETRTGFRPAQFDPGTADMRNLGVWVEAP